METATGGSNKEQEKARVSEPNTTFADLLERNWKFWVLIGAIILAGWIANASFNGAIDGAVERAIAPLRDDVKAGFDDSGKRFDKIDVRLDAVDKSVNEHNATLARLDERTRDRSDKK